MLSYCQARCTFVALSNHFSSATTFWWSLNWLLNKSLTVCLALINVGKEFQSLTAKVPCSNPMMSGSSLWNNPLHSVSFA